MTQEPEQPRLDVEQFYAAIDGTRMARNVSWREIARLVGVSASTLTRLRQGSRPDVDTFFKLCAWAGISPHSFDTGQATGPPDEPGVALPAISALLRSDPNLSSDEAALLETVLFSAYEKLTKPNS